MNGTLATSGSLASRCRKRVIAATPSIMPSSMQMSRTLAPFSTCWRATADGFFVFAFLDELGELGRAGDVGALADHDEDAGLLREGLRAGKTQRPRRRGLRLGSLTRHAARCVTRAAVGNLRGGRPSRALAIAAMCSGVLPQQPPAILISPPRANSPRERAMSAGPRSKPVGESGLGKPGIRIAGDGDVRFLRELGQERIHQIGTERAVEADRQAASRARTAFQNASMVCAEIIVSPPRPTAAEIMTGSFDLSVLVEHFADGDQRRLGVERVEDRLHQQQVRRRRR